MILTDPYDQVWSFGDISSVWGFGNGLENGLIFTTLGKRFSSIARWLEKKFYAGWIVQYCCCLLAVCVLSSNIWDLISELWILRMIILRLEVHKMHLLEIIDAAKSNPTTSWWWFWATTPPGLGLARNHVALYQRKAFIIWFGLGLRMRLVGPSMQILVDGNILV